MAVRLSVALMAALGLVGTWGSLGAQVISLADADLTIHGAANDDQMGQSAAAVGDVNGDGIADFAVASTRVDTSNGGNSGQVVVIFGNGTLPSIVDLLVPSVTLTGVDGASGGDRLGLDVTGLGDFNGDGIDDFAVSASKASFSGRERAGVVYVIFGSTTLPASIDVGSLGGAGIIIGGAGPDDQLARSLAGVGDFNDDGWPDLLVGADRADPLGRSNAGDCALIFGGDSLPSTIDLASLGALGILFHGASWGDNLGSAVAGIGDFNGDDIPDIALGAMHADPHGYSSGRITIVCGQSVLPASAEVNDLAAAGLVGFDILGITSGDHLGSAADGVGDFDGDGLDDLVVCAAEADRGGMNEVGEAYLILGTKDLPGVMDLAKAAPLVTFRGIAQGDRFGRTVAGLGDVTGDASPDFLIGADRANPNGANNAGAAYLIRGGQALPSLVTGGDFATYGMKYYGIDAGDQAGTRVSAAGDVNGDGGLDFIITAICASPQGRSLGGEVYVFHGETLLSPSALGCQAQGTHVSLSWSNGQLYEAIEVYRDGTLVATLAGDATTYEDEVAPAGTHDYMVIGMADGNTTLPVECTLSIIVLPPFDLACTSDEKQVSLSWVNGQTYTAIEVLREGAVVATLAGNATSFNDPALVPGLYQYCVRGLNGTDVSTEACCDIEVPLPVTDLFCDVDEQAVTLDWTSGQIYDGVEIERDGTLIVTLPGDATTFTDLGVAPGDHEYRVFGVLGGSRATGVSCVVTVVAPVESLVCSAVGDTATLNWVNPTPYDSLQILRDGALIATLPGADTSYVDLGLAPGSYTYEVVAENSGSTSAPTECSVTILIPIIDFQCTASADEVFLSWTNGQVYGSIDLYRDAVLLVTLSGSANSYRDEGVPSGPHSYELVANAPGTETSPLVCDVEVLEPPFDVTCVSAAGSVTLGWSNGSTYDAVLLSRNGSLIATLSGDATSYVDMVSPGSYLYELVGQAASSESAVTSCEVVDPGAPFGLVCAASGDTATLSWQNGDLYDGVEILVDGILDQSLPGDATGATVTGLATGVHTLCVVGIIGRDSSNPACCDLTVPIPVSDFGCSAEGDSVLLTWTNGQPYETIEILRDGTLVASIPGFVNQYTDTSVPAGLHSYELVASLGGGSTLPVACDITVLAPITGVDCSGSEGDVSLTWTNGDLYDSITVRRNGLLVATLGGGAQSYAESGLSAGFYVYELTGFLGSSSSTTPVACAVTLPLAPFGLNCTLSGGDSVQLNWSNSQVGDEIIVLRNGAILDVLPGTQSTYTDEPVAAGSYTYCLQNSIDGNGSNLACCDVVVPVPPIDVTCTSLGTGVELSWSNGDSYESVVIRRNGLFLAAVPGSESSFFDPGVPSGAYTYTLSGFVAGFESAGVNCTVTVPPAPASLSCVVNFATVELGWTLSVAYDTVTIFRNGAVLVTLPGDADSYVDNTATAGNWTYEVVGAIGADMSPPAVCAVEILAGPSDLTCCASDGDVQLCWQNPVAYDTIEIYLSGFLAATLPGDTTCFDDTISEVGEYSYDVVGLAGGAGSAPAFCSVLVMDAPFGVICEVSNPTQLQPDVVVSWSNGDSYDSIEIHRGGNLLATVGGFTSSYVDLDLAAGTYSYMILGVRVFGDCSEAQSTLCSVEVVIPEFVRGDANNDTQIDVADSVWTLNYLFIQGLAPPCFDAADINDDGFLDISDSIFMLGYQFFMGPPPPAPFPSPGPDPTDDNLGCESSAWSP